MIAKLIGVLDSLGEDSLIIDVSGVGYLVFCSSRTLRSIGKFGDPLTLFIETHVREDHIHFYGFLDPSEHEWFRLLTTVQGVGAKVALAVLGTLTPKELENAFLTEDKALLTRAPGVGQRLAVRLLAELRDKISGFGVLSVKNSVGEVVDNSGPISDAVSALMNLGYGRAAAFGAVSHSAQELGEEITVENLVKAGLQELST